MLEENRRTQLPSARAEGVREEFQRAVALFRQGKPGEAERTCLELVERHPHHFGVLSLLGLLALRSRRFRRAALFLSRATVVNPNSAGVYNNFGEALRQLRRPRQALANYDKAIALDPNYAAAHSNRAIALFDLQRYAEAVESCDRALAIAPNSPRALNNRGNALRNLDRYEEALVCYDRALAIAPKFAKAHLNRGATLHDLDRLEEALEACDVAIALAPQNADGWFNRGNSLRELNRVDEAIANFGKAIALKPSYRQPRWNQGNCFLMKGEFANGLELYEYRKKTPAAAKRSQSWPESLWRGREEIAGKTLFVHPELFLGDMIQFCRYARLAEERGARVVLAAQKQLCRLLGGLSRTMTIIPDEAEPPAFDLHCPLMSLPLAFGTKLETIYAPSPYLFAEDSRIATWREKIGSHGIKVGICWQGSTTAYAVKLQRSFPLLLFRDLAKTPGVRLISLQKNDGLDQLASLPADMKVETLGDEFDAGPDSFLDSAAVLHALDLVITTDTALAHLAGALARPVWVVLKHIADWRWLVDREDSPWYPSMRLFRQSRRSDWQSVFEKIQSAFVEQFVQSARP